MSMCDRFCAFVPCNALSQSFLIIDSQWLALVPIDAPPCACVPSYAFLGTHLAMGAVDHGHWTVRLDYTAASEVGFT